MNRSQPSPVTFDKKDVEIIARETLYRGFFSLNLYRFRHRLFNGEMSLKSRVKFSSAAMRRCCCPMIRCAMKWC